MKQYKWKYVTAMNVYILSVVCTSSHGLYTGYINVNIKINKGE